MKQREDAVTVISCANRCELIKIISIIARLRSMPGNFSVLVYVYSRHQEARWVSCLTGGKDTVVSLYRESIAVETTVASEAIMQCLHNTGVAQHHQLLRKPTETSEVLRQPRKTPETMLVDDRVFTVKGNGPHAPQDACERRAAPHLSSVVTSFPCGRAPAANHNERYLQV